MNKVLTFILYRIIWLISLLPLCVLYLITDIFFLFFLLLPPLRYRRKIVRKNLRNSFPDKSEKWLRRTEIRFYHGFCDLIAEIVKGCSMTPKTMARRLRWVGVGQIVSDFEHGRSAMLYLGHCMNWEWVTSIGLNFDPVHVAAHVYHPLENKVMNDVICRIRHHYGAVNIPMDKVLRYLLEYRSEGRQYVLGMIADQVPQMKAIHYWTNFLNQDTPVFTGTERMARKLDTAMYYGDMTRVSRGHYQIEIKPLCEHPSELQENELTERYFRMLEDSIRRKPELWLWSHNRWKRTREAYEQWLAEKKIHRD